MIEENADQEPWNQVIYTNGNWCEKKRKEVSTNVVDTVNKH